MQGSSRRKVFAGLCLLMVWQTGCAAFRPVQGVPARFLPAEMKVGERSDRRTINVSLLGQSPPPAHLVDAGDVLGVYVEGFVGKASDPPPVYFPANNEAAPSFGLPFPVREDGTISLPAVGSVNVRGLTLVQAEERVKQAYLAPRELIRPDFHRVQVNLQRPRHYRVLVIRQDSHTEPQTNGSVGQMNIGLAKRGTGKVVNLPAYSNDVLNALTASDGLPGLDAENAVYIIRRRGNFQGAATDPRWPADLNPDVLIQQGAIESPVIRGQSSDSDSGYLHSQNVVRALYVGPRGHDVQQIGTNPEPARHGYYPPKPALNNRTPLEPPRIWADRPINTPIAFEQDRVEVQPGASTYGAASYGSDNPGPTQSYGPAPPYGSPPPVGANAGPYSFTPTAPDYRANQPIPAGPLPGEPLNPGPTGPGRNAMPAAPGQGPPGTSGHGMPAGNPSYGPGIDPELPINDDSGHGLPGVDSLDGRKVIRIPIRLGPGETADIRPEDVVLYDGDIVFIESRDTEVFYTAGLLGGGQFTLPRDYDLDILQALSLAQSRGTNSARSVGGVSSLNNDVSISPSTAIVLRKLPDGGEVPVKVDLYRARTDLSERIVIQPGDYILLQYTPLEAVGAFIERHLLETALFGLAAQQFRTGN